MLGHRLRDSAYPRTRETPSSWPSGFFNTLLEREDEIGSIEPGKLADLILVEGDPTTRTADLRNVETVFKDGVGYDPASLREEARGQVGLR